MELMDNDAVKQSHLMELYQEDESEIHGESLQRWKGQSG